MAIKDWRAVLTVALCAAFAAACGKGGGCSKKDKKKDENKPPVQQGAPAQPAPVGSQPSGG